MDVEVLLFGPAAIAHGGDRVAVRLESTEGLSSADLLATIARQHTHLEPFVHSGRIASGGSYADPHAPIDTHQELALIAMVSGG